MFSKYISHISGFLIIFVFFWMFFTGLYQIKFEIHRFIYHKIGAYILVSLVFIHTFVNRRMVIQSIRDILLTKFGTHNIGRKIKIKSIVSILLLIFVLITFVLGNLQVRLNLPHSKFIYHIAIAYLSMALTLVHILFNIKQIRWFLISKKAVFYMAPIILLLSGGSYFLIFKMRSVDNAVGHRIYPTDSYPVRPQMVPDSTKDFRYALTYHIKTKHSPFEIFSSKEKGYKPKKRPSFIKTYRGAKMIRLDREFDFDSPTFDKIAGFLPNAHIESPRSITLKDTSLILYHTYGVTDVVRLPGVTYYLKAAPSAGALYPAEIYMIVEDFDDLEPGIYHYNILMHSLELVREGRFLDRLYRICSNPTTIRESSVAFVISAIFDRTKWRYRERGYRYVLMDIGHLTENLALIVNSLGFRPHIIGRFIDDAVNELIGLDGLKESVLCIVSIEIEDKKLIKEKSDYQFLKTKPHFGLNRRFEGDQMEGLSISEKLHLSSKLTIIPKTVKKGLQYRIIRKNSEFKEKAHKRIFLPKQFFDIDVQIDDIIRGRRSTRDYIRRPIELSELSRLLFYSFGYNDATKRLFVDSIESLYPLRMYVVANNVDGLKRGIYYYDFFEHSLWPIKIGDFSRPIGDAALFQRFVQKAGVVFVITTFFERIRHYGDRGYRYALLDCGRVGERIYLGAVSMGLGVCGVGAFFDDQVNSLIGVDGMKETTIYLVAVGKIK